MKKFGKISKMEQESLPPDVKEVRRKLQIEFGESGVDESLIIEGLSSTPSSPAITLEEVKKLAEHVVEDAENSQ